MELLNVLTEHGVVPRFDRAAVRAQFGRSSGGCRSMEHRDSGLLGITTKHLYFKGSQKSFRVRLEKIVSLEPYRNGIEIMRDTARAKLEVFKMRMFDAWFSVNLIDALLDRDDLTLSGPDAPTLDDLVDPAPDRRGPVRVRHQRSAMSDATLQTARRRTRDK